MLRAWRAVVEFVTSNEERPACLLIDPAGDAAARREHGAPGSVSCPAATPSLGRHLQEAVLGDAVGIRLRFSGSVAGLRGGIRSPRSRAHRLTRAVGYLHSVLEGGWWPSCFSGNQETRPPHHTPGKAQSSLGVTRGVWFPPPAHGVNGFTVGRSVGKN